MQALTKFTYLLYTLASFSVVRM